MSHNMFQFIGNLTRDTELHNNPGGGSRAIFDIAQNRTWGKGADRQEKTEFFRIKSFGAIAESAAQYLGKGSKVFVQGRIENYQFDKDGKTEYGINFIAEKIDYLDTKAPGYQG